MVAIRKRKRYRTGRTHPPVVHDAYKRGHADGFQRGKEDGFLQGRKNAQALLESTQTITDQAALDVLVITAGIIPTLEIGVIQPLSALNKRINLHFDVKLENDVSKEMIAAAKTIVFVRNVEPEAYRLLEWALELKKRTVYVIDDNFLEIQPTTPVGVYYCEPIIRETFIKFLRNVHIIKVDAPDLGSYIHDKFNRNVIYFPGSVDFDWLDQQERKDRENNQIVIGYEGGDKAEDFAPVILALEKILNYYGGFVRLEFYGYVPASLADHPSVTYIEGNIEYKSFIQKLKQANWDIGLAPLGENLFNQGKTNNKLREYAACRIPGIYSECSVYKPWVKHGETGYLTKHTEDGWYEAIKEMIENPSMRLCIKENAEQAARDHFSLNTCVENWQKYLLGRS